MRKQLLDIYYSILDEGCAPESEYQKQLSKVVNLEDAVKQDLPQAFLLRFNAYNDAVMKLAEVACEDAFVSGYRTGARLMLAALVDVQE